MVIRHNLWVKIGRLVTVAAAGATVISQSERSVEARKYHDQSKERGLQDRSQIGIQSIESSWLRIPRRSSFLPSSSANHSVAQPSFILQCLRAQKDDTRGVVNATRPGIPGDEFAPYVEGSWVHHAVEVIMDMDAGRSLEATELCNDARTEQNIESAKSLDESHIHGGNKHRNGFMLSDTYPLASLAWTLHHASIDLFADFAPLLSRSLIFDEYKASILEDVGRLYLWGESFDEEQLALILQSSAGLRSLVLELTDTLCTTLTEDLFPLIQTSCSDPALLLQVDGVRDLLVQLHQQAASSKLETYGTTDYSVSDSEVCEVDFSPQSVAAMIRSSVDCLMQLLPSMERTLEVANKRLVTTQN